MPTRTVAPLEDTCQTIVVSGGGIPGEYPLYTGGQIDGKDAWASDDHAIYFVDLTRRRRLEVEDDVRGEGFVDGHGSCITDSLHHAAPLALVITLV